MDKLVWAPGNREGVALRAARRAGFGSDAVLDRASGDLQAARGLAERLGPDALCLVLEGVDAQPIRKADWDGAVMGPLGGCFNVVNAIGRKMRAGGQGKIVALIPACALRPVESQGQVNVLARALLGLMEGLRAELQSTQVAVSIVFHDGEAEDEAALAHRLSEALDAGDFYRLSPALDRDAIQAYFEPILSALSQTSSGPPLPDIGPMAAVYLQPPEMRGESGPHCGCP